MNTTEAFWIVFAIIIFGILIGTVIYQDVQLTKLSKLKTDKKEKEVKTE